jgi:hypothetical protein
MYWSKMSRHGSARRLLLFCLRPVIGPRPKIARCNHFSAKIRGTRPPPTRRPKAPSGDDVPLSLISCHHPRRPQSANLYLLFRSAATSMTWSDSMRPFLPLSGIATASPTSRASRFCMETSRPTRSSLMRTRRRIDSSRALPASTRRTRM